MYFVPALTGLGSPHWDPYARGTIVGLTRGTGRAHLARATLEAIAYQTRRRGARDGGGVRTAARASCGSTAARRANAWLMQFQADVLGVPGRACREIAETTALGAALPRRRRRRGWTVSDVRGALARGRRATSRAMGEDERATLLAGWSAGASSALRELASRVTVWRGRR